MEQEIAKMRLKDAAMKLDSNISIAHAWSSRARLFRFVEPPTCTVAEAVVNRIWEDKLYELIDVGAVDSLKIGQPRLIKLPSLSRLLESPK